MDQMYSITSVPAHFASMTPGGFIYSLYPDTTQSTECLHNNVLSNASNILPNADALECDPSAPALEAMCLKATDALQYGLDSRQTNDTGHSLKKNKPDLKEAKSRRRSQNRAAQRAFRERKERHVHELEAKLVALELSNNSLQLDNKCLQLALNRVYIENEILRATSGQSPRSPWLISTCYAAATAKLADKKDHSMHDARSPSTESAVSSSDKDQSSFSTKSCDTSATQPWDLVHSHPLVKQGLIQLTDVCGHLHNTDMLEGRGKAIEEIIFWAALESLRSDSGSLLRK